MLRKMFQRNACRTALNSKTRNRSRRLLNVESLETRAMLSSVSVTHGGDSGPGSFRAAVEQANADSSINEIVFNRDVNEVGVGTPLVYTGWQDLEINGRGASIEQQESVESAFDLFVSNSGGDLVLRKIAFRDSLANGVVVNIPSYVQGEVSVELQRVKLIGNAQSGLLINDLESMSASINLDVVDSKILRNGSGDRVADGDGIRVIEKGNGDIIASIRNSRMNRNGGDGLDLVEGDEGNGMLTVEDDSRFNNNGGNGIQMKEEDVGDP